MRETELTIITATADDINPGPTLHSDGVQAIRESAREKTKREYTIAISLLLLTLVILFSRLVIKNDTGKNALEILSIFPMFSALFIAAKNTCFCPNRRHQLFVAPDAKFAELARDSKNDEAHRLLPSGTTQNS